MKIEELRKIAKARTTGRWCYSTCYGVAFIETPDRKTGIACAVDYLSPNNADAIVEMSNHIDALLDLWAAAQSMGNHTLACEAIIMEPPGPCDCGFDNLRSTMQKLDGIK